MDKKYGVYICTGCGIGDVLDIESLGGIASEEGLPVKNHEFLCGKDGVSLIKKDIEENGTNTIIIGACSRRVNFDTFRFDGCIIDRVNLREQVVWSHPRSDFPALEEDQKDDGEHFDRLQMLAEDYMRMGVAKIEKISLPEPYLVENLSRKILVIGGGITGLSSAMDAAKAGYDVTIVDKEASLGGYAAKIRKQLPVKEPYDNLINPVISAKIREVESYSNITVKTGTVVARIAGQPGEFTVTMKNPGEKIPFDVPFPLPDEMKVDENGKDLDVEAQHQKYLEYNEGRKISLSWIRTANCSAPSFWPPDGAPLNWKAMPTPIWDMVNCPTW
jgi:quinone-modifying oxidoreductase subunit QmoB